MIVEALRRKLHTSPAESEQNPEIKREKIERAAMLMKRLFNLSTALTERLETKQIKKGPRKWDENWIQILRDELIRRAKGNSRNLGPLIYAHRPADRLLIPENAPPERVGGLNLERVDYTMFHHHNVDDQAICCDVSFIDDENNALQLVRKFLIRKGSRLGIIEVYSDPVPASVEVEVEGKRKPISNLFAAQTTQTVRLYDYLEASGAKVLGYIPYSEDEQLNMHFSILEQIPEESRRWQKAKLPTWHERDMAHD